MFANRQFKKKGEVFPMVRHQAHGRDTSSIPMALGDATEREQQSNMMRALFELSKTW